MLPFKFITSVSFDVNDTDVIIHTYLFTFIIQKIKVALLIPIQVLK